MKLALLESSIDIAQVLSGKKNLDTPLKKTTTSTPSATKPNHPEEKEMQLPAEKVAPDKEPEAISEPKAENHSTLSLEIIKQSWGNIISELEKNNSKIAHFLEDATLNKFDGTHLWIELINGHHFHQRTLEKDIAKIEAKISSVLSEKIRIKFLMKENAENKAKQKKPANVEHPLFEKVLETFEGEIIR